MINNLVIVGAGGFFLELYEYLLNDIENKNISSVSIKGVLDDQIPVKPLPTKYLGTIREYIPHNNDVFLIAIGNVKHRENIFNILKEKSARFFTYIHSTALVSSSATLGEGTIVCPMSIVNAKAQVEQNVSINVHTSIGHEARVGPHSVLSPYSALNGSANIGSKVFLGTRATVFPSVTVGDECVIDSHTAVRRPVEAKMLLSDRTEFISVKNRYLG